MKSPSRRTFLKRSAALGTGAAALGLNPSAVAREPYIRFPSALRDRLSVTSWPFRAYIESPHNRYRDAHKPGMTLLDFAPMVATRFRVYNINPLSWHFGSTDSAYLDKLRNSIEKAKSHLVGLGLSGGAFYDPDPQKRKVAVENAKKWIDIAAIVGSPSVRPQINEPHRFSPDVDRAAQTFGALADYGSRKNVVVNMENDDPVTQDPFFIAKVIEKVANPYLRALPDFGNSAVKGPEFNARALAVMFQHAYNMSHVKDAAQDEHDKIYKVDVPKAFAIAKASGYRGYFSMEYDMDFGDPFRATHRLIDETLHDAV
jgi:sugar phosphate isomerase/epimerase